MRNPRIYGHRGASAAAPENTLEAFALARRQGADGVELDVRRSADGALVLHHDPDLPDGRIIGATLAADLPATVPHLAAALDSCAGMIVNVEIKNIPGESDFDDTCSLADDVVALLHERNGDTGHGDTGDGDTGHGDTVLVSCFHLATIDRVKSLDPDLPTGLLSLIEPTAADSVRLAADRGHQAIHPYFLFVDEALVESARAAGVEINAWTVNDPDAVRRLAELGVDGIVTDVPDVVAATLTEELS